MHVTIYGNVYVKQSINKPNENNLQQNKYLCAEYKSIYKSLHHRDKSKKENFVTLTTICTLHYPDDVWFFNTDILSGLVVLPLHYFHILNHLHQVFG